MTHAMVLTDDFRVQIEELQARLRQAEIRLEHLAITRKTVTALADRIPTRDASPDLAEHPGYPRILAVFNEATGPTEHRDQQPCVEMTAVSRCRRHLPGRGTALPVRDGQHGQQRPPQGQRRVAEIEPGSFPAAGLAWGVG